MSALRVGRPGEPIRLIDLGASMARVSHTRGVVFGGVVVIGESERTRKLRLKRERNVRYREGHRTEPRIVEKCDRPLKLVGEPCARMAGHRQSCRSAAALASAAADRRTSR